jgi:methionyl-tRNA formyltransferase
VSCAAGRSPDLRLAFLGTPDAAVVTLQALLDAGHDLPIVVSRADTRRGRGAQFAPSPVKAAALEAGLTVTDRVEDVVDAGVDLGVVVAFGRLIRPPVLAQVPMVNLHFSLLPRWRGAAPVERAILAGDPTTGVCVMAVEAGLDTGGVYRRWETAIEPGETVDHLRHRLATGGSALLVDALDQGLGDPEPQAGEATYAAKIEPADRRLDWAQPAAQVDRVVRIGRSWTTWRGRRLLVLAGHPAAGTDVAVGGDPVTPGSLVSSDRDGPAVATGEGRFVLTTVQPEGKGPQDASAWWRGARPRPEERLDGDLDGYENTR